MKTTLRLLSVIFAMSAFVALKATPVYVGSWSVYHPDAPSWSAFPPDGPLAYTGQEAAALLFGGVASDYYISTVSNQVADINNSAWYDVIGYGLTLQAEDYFVKYLGQYYGPTSGYTGELGVSAASAFVRDNLSGFDGLNYAFRISGGNNVPDTGATVSLLGAGLIALAAMRRKRN